MKYYLLILFSIALFSCNSVKKTEQALNSGNYVTAINTSVNKLQKNKFNKKSPIYAGLLKRAFERYRTSTLDRIDFLERETLKDNSKEVYQLYVQLQSVQN
ncbi:hypothetical protein [Psychroflexus tropicus]|uniref:hypothetical protein n=1 Tax=Psychroflexus tropicus TaxID=197345 RepID=UPI0003648F18|nr:hypothetical protein [Psychroflexus tropicus]